MSVHYANVEHALRHAVRGQIAHLHTGQGMCLAGPLLGAVGDTIKIRANDVGHLDVPIASVAVIVLVPHHVPEHLLDLGLPAAN